MSALRNQRGASQQTRRSGRPDRYLPMRMDIWSELQRLVLVTRLRASLGTKFLTEARRLRDEILAAFAAEGRVS
jgi:hypothetical protein